MQNLEKADDLKGYEDTKWFAKFLIDQMSE